MVMHLRIGLALTFASMATGVSAAPLTLEKRVELARIIAKGFGLSAAGVELYAREIVRSDDRLPYAAVNAADLALAHELERDEPDRSRLQALLRRVTEARALVEAERQRNEVDVVLLLPAADRKILARLKRSSLEEEMRKVGPTATVEPSETR